MADKLKCIKSINEIPQ